MCVSFKADTHNPTPTVDRTTCHNWPSVIVADIHEQTCWVDICRFCLLGCLWDLTLSAVTATKDSK